ncbi:50S ribosomal protein L9 [Planctomycetota bacterium]|jgi:large subunit ribosomal protein L9|nr:50S ribosomal protein L9 [Planctomycetota bacterium]GDY01542.1 50S ribosomal protein L9 [Planctomycetota bacterium]
MELLLRQNVEHLGRVGDVVKVKSGYARNFLLPMGFAVPVTKANMAVIERARAVVFAEEQARLATLKELAQKFTDTSITIESRANEEGHLFGSVSQAQIVSALREKGFAIEEKQVRLEQPLKEIGVFDVVLHLHQGVDATIKVWVVQQKPQ